jgi:hypothetical protein
MERNATPEFGFKRRAFHRSPLVSVVVSVAQLVLLSACATERLEYQSPDNATSKLVVASGYFSGGRDVRKEEQTCFPAEVIDCGPPPVARASFVTKNSILNSLPRLRTTLRVNLLNVDDQFPIGDATSVLVFVTSDGRRHDLNRYYMLYRDRRGNEVLPALQPDDIPYLPCVDEPLATLIDFADPPPVVPNEEFKYPGGAREALGKGSLREGDADTYYRYGVLLSDIAALYAQRSSTESCDWN